MSTLMNDAERDECVRLFRDEDKSAREIATLYKRHPRTIEKMLRRRGIGKHSRPQRDNNAAQAPAE